MSAKSKSQKTKGNSKSKAKEAPVPQDTDGYNQEFPTPEESKKQAQSKAKTKSVDDDSTSDGEETHDEKTMNGTKDHSDPSETKKSLSNGRCFSLTNWWTKLPRFSSQFRSHLPEDPYQTNLYQKLEPYHHKINTYSTAFVIRTKILILAIFWLHVVSWLGLSLLLGLVNILTFFAGPWSLFPIVGWSLILLGHFFITHRLLKGAGQNDLEWVDSKLWDYLDQAKDISAQALLTCRTRSQSLMAQTKPTLAKLQGNFRTTANHYVQMLRKKTSNQG